MRFSMSLGDGNGHSRHPAPPRSAATISRQATLALRLSFFRLAYAHCTPPWLTRKFMIRSNWYAYRKAHCFTVRELLIFLMGHRPFQKILWEVRRLPEARGSRHQRGGKSLRGSGIGLPLVANATPRSG